MNQKAFLEFLSFMIKFIISLDLFIPVMMIWPNFGEWMQRKLSKIMDTANRKYLRKVFTLLLARWRYQPIKLSQGLWPIQMLAQSISLKTSLSSNLLPLDSLTNLPVSLLTIQQTILRILIDWSEKSWDILLIFSLQAFFLCLQS